MSHTCSSCGHKWRSAERDPRCCERCHCPYWQKERRYPNVPTPRCSGLLGVGAGNRLRDFPILRMENYR